MQKCVDQSQLNDACMHMLPALVTLVQSNYVFSHTWLKNPIIQMTSFHKCITSILQKQECVAHADLCSVPFCQTVCIMGVATKGSSIMDTQKVLYTGTIICV